jgi:hypothetical protein
VSVSVLVLTTLDICCLLLGMWWVRSESEIPRL